MIIILGALFLGAPLGGRRGNTGLAGYEPLPHPGWRGCRRTSVPLAGPRAGLYIAPPLPSGTGTTTSASHPLACPVPREAGSFCLPRERGRGLFSSSFLNQAFGQTRGSGGERARGIPVGLQEEWAWPPPTQSRCGDCSLARRAMHFVWLGRKRPPPPKGWAGQAGCSPRWTGTGMGAGIHLTDDHPAQP